MKQKANKVPIVEETKAMPETKEMRGYNSLDEAFVSAYCNAPRKGKTSALLEAGFAGSHPSQEAYRMYNRLKDKIKARTDILIESLDTLAADQLLNILKEDIETVGYNNMSKAIQQGMDYAGRKPGDVLTIKKEVTLQDINGSIEALQRELDYTEGKDLH